METKQMKVLHLDAELLWRGGQQQAVYLGKGLLDKGLPGIFVCRTGSKLEEYLRDNKLDHLSLPFRGELDILAGFRLAAYARRNRFTILIAHSAHALSWGLLARLFYPALKLIAVRRVDFPISRGVFSRFKYRPRMLDRIVAISENIRRVLLADGIPAPKISLIHSGVDVSKHAAVEPPADFRERWNIPREAVLVGTVAAFTGHKDYPNFLAAAALVLKQESQVRFMAVGDGVLLDKMRQQVRESGISDQVIFTGHQQEVGKFLKSWDIFVLASKKEGLGTSVLDAMALGLPVVGTAAGGIPEMISDGVNGLLVPFRDPQALANAILKLVRQPSLRNALGEAARSRVQDFDKDIMVSKYLELLSEL